MIKIVLDTLIPGDIKFKMPSASILDFNTYKIKHGIQQIVIDFLFELTKISNNQFSRDFNELDEDQRMKVLNVCKLKI